jgi:hypothetical protein
LAVMISVGSGWVIRRHQHYPDIREVEGHVSLIIVLLQSPGKPASRSTRPRYPHSSRRVKCLRSRISIRSSCPARSPILVRKYLGLCNCLPVSAYIVLENSLRYLAPEMCQTRIPHFICTNKIIFLRSLTLQKILICIIILSTLLGDS